MPPHILAVYTILEMLGVHTLQLFLFPEEAAFLALTCEAFMKRLAANLIQVPAEVCRLRALVQEPYPPDVTIVTLHQTISWPRWVKVFGPNNRRKLLALRVDRIVEYIGKGALQIVFDCWEAYCRIGATVQDDGLLTFSIRVSGLT